MLLGQGIIFFALLIVTAICSDEKIENDNELHSSTQLHCDIICLGSGGDGEFDPKNQTCKCSNNTDGAERELMEKNAKVHNVTLEKSEVRKRRETDSNSERVGQQLPRIPSRNRQSTLRPTFGLSSTRRPLRSSTRSPITFPTFSTTRRTSLLSTRNPRILPNLGGDAQKRIHEIQQRINDQLRNRARNVPNFQQRASEGDQSAAKVLEQIRQRQKELQERLRSAINSEHGDGRIGASLRKESDVQVKPKKGLRAKGETSNKGGQQEIITQPTELYDHK